MNRRSFLLHSTAIAGTGMALAGCSTISGTIGQTIDSSLATAVDYAKAVSGGVSALLNYLPVLNVSTDVQSTIQTAVAGVNQVASDIGGVLTEAAAQPLAQKLATYAGTIVSALLAIPALPPVVMTILKALQVAIPAILSILGIAGVTAPRGPDVYNAIAALKQYGVR